MKQKIVALLRKLRLLTFADYVKFLVSSAHYSGKNRRFRKMHPRTVLPPAYMLYESFGKLDYESYYSRGKESAEYIIGFLQKHKNLENARICEWGCGPARLLRHFSDILRDSAVELYGTDYNRTTITWCRRNIPSVTFKVNNLNPPLDFPADFFDAVFCVSVFTHLSRDVQIKWLRECLRVVKPGGIFLMTVHGDACSGKLMAHESETYTGAGCVVRAGVKEGQRNYTAYNSPDYMRNVLLKDLEVVEFLAGDENVQDIWIIRK